MVMPKRFQTVGPIIATYDYTDIAEGTGIITFNACAAKNSAGTTYFLTKNTLNSATIGSTLSTPQDNDYDAVFNIPRRVQGTAYVNITLGANATAPNNRVMTVTVTLKHYDGSTETNLAATQTSASFEITQGTISSRMDCFKIPITTEKDFKKGDILRLTVTTATSAGSGSYGYGHDPADRDNDNYFLAAHSTKLQILVPFRIEV